MSTSLEPQAVQQLAPQDKGLVEDADTGVDEKDFKNVLNETLDYMNPWVEDARKDQEFYALKQWPKEDVRRAKKSRRAALVFDRTRPIIDAVTGSEVTNRYEAKFKARDPDLMEPDTPYSEETSDMYKYVRDNCNAKHHDSAAFKDCVITGVGATETVMGYVRNPDGEILVKHVPVMELGWDGASIEPNLSDARWILRDRWVDYDELIQLFGRDKIDEVIELAGTTSMMGGASKGFLGKLVSRITEDQTAGYNQKGVKYYDPRTKRLRMWEWQYRKRFYGTRIFYPDIEALMADPAFLQLMQAAFANPGAAQPFDVPAGDLIVPRSEAQTAIGMINEELDQFNAEVLQPLGLEPLQSADYIEDFPQDRYYRCFMAGTRKLKEQRLLVDNYTYQFITCFEDWSDPSYRYFFGAMRPMRDPQLYANKFLSHAIHMWSSNPKGALMAEKSFFEDRRQAATEWAEAAGFMTVRDGALQSAKPRFVHLTNNVSLRGVETLLSHAIGSVSSALGVSEQYFVGSAGDLKRTAAQSIEHVTQQSMITLSNPFDSLKLYRERHARLFLGYLREFLDEKTVQRVLGPGAAILQVMKTRDLLYLYDIVVDDAPDSKNKQQEVFQMMMETNFLPQLLQMGVAPPPSIAKYFPMPGDIRQDFETAFQQAYDLQVLQAEVQKAQLQLQMMQMQMDPMGMGMGMPPGAPPDSSGTVEGGEPPAQA